MNDSIMRIKLASITWLLLWDRDANEQSVLTKASPPCNER